MTLLAAAVLTGICMETFTVAWDVLLAHVPTDRLARVCAYDILGSMVAIPMDRAPPARSPRPSAPTPC